MYKPDAEPFEVSRSDADRLAKGQVWELPREKIVVALISLSHGWWNCLVVDSNNPKVEVGGFNLSILADEIDQEGIPVTVDQPDA